MPIKECFSVQGTPSGRWYQVPGVKVSEHFAVVNGGEQYRLPFSWHRRTNALLHIESGLCAITFSYFAARTHIRKAEWIDLAERLEELGKPSGLWGHNLNKVKPEGISEEAKRAFEQSELLAREFRKKYYRDNA